MSDDFIKQCPTALLERVVKLEAETLGQREQAKAHKEDTQRRLDKLEQYIKDSNAATYAKLDAIVSSQNKQAEILSRGRGMGAVLATIGISATGALASLIVWIITKANH